MTELLLEQRHLVLSKRNSGVATQFSFLAAVFQLFRSYRNSKFRHFLSFFQINVIIIVIIITNKKRQSALVTIYNIGAL